MTQKRNQRYQYTGRQIRQRNIQKSERAETLRKNIDKLRKKIQEDLESEDEKIRTMALVTYVIDKTKARVGNRNSEKNRGHYGVTGLLKKHLRFEGGNAVFRYTGKSGVEQKKIISDKKLVKELKEVSEGKEKDEPLFSYEYRGRKCLLDSEDMREYLEEFGVTAKDIRGYHANKEMATSLKEIRKRGERLPPKARQEERKEFLEKEFKEALEEVSEQLGHKPETLKNQYLVPGFEEFFMENGYPMTRLNKKSGIATKVARRYISRGGLIRTASVEKGVTELGTLISHMREQAEMVRGVDPEIERELRRSLQKLDELIFLIEEKI